MALLRLDKIIADSGFATRSEASLLIKRGLVTVDGVMATSGAVKLNPEAAEVTVSGETLEYKRCRYLMMNKPAGLITATEDLREQTVMTLLTERERRLGLFPAGRLDKDTEGLLLLTNDGEFAHKVMSPVKKVSKRYYAILDGEVIDEDIEAFERGVKLGDGTECRPAKLERASDGGVYITLWEGKYHQVKRMAAAIGKPVRYLKRVAIGRLTLEKYGETGKTLAPGEYRELIEHEIYDVFEEW